MLNDISISWRGIITPEQNRELDIWLPRRINKGATKVSEGDYVYDNALPISIYPRKQNARIVAQQGVFTVHGVNRKPLNHWLEEMHSPVSNVLTRIDLKSLTRDRALQQLNALGVRRHSLFPDISNYVAYLKQKHGW